MITRFFHPNYLLTAVLLFNMPSLGHDGLKRRCRCARQQYGE